MKQEGVKIRFWWVQTSFPGAGGMLGVRRCSRLPEPLEAKTKEGKEVKVSALILWWRMKG
jgi:hypothetical protein